MRNVTATLALGAALLAAAPAADAAVDFPAPLARGDTGLLTIDYVDRFADQAIFDTVQKGNARVEVFGLGDTVLASTAAFGDSFAVAIGNVEAGGTLGAFRIVGLGKGGHALDIASSVASAGAGCGAACEGSFGVRVTLTPVPAGAALLLPALAGLGWLGRRRRRAASAA